MRQLFPSLRRHVSKRRQNRNWVVSAKPTLEALEDRIVPAVAIPDQSTVFATFEVTEAVQIADVNVTLDITHGRAKDLDVFLISPSNTRVELFTDVGGNGDDFSGTTLDDEAATPITSGSAPFSGSFQPEGSLSDFDGQDAQGTWRLEISDDQKNVEGMLNSWSIEITESQTGVPIAPPPGILSWWTGDGNAEDIVGPNGGTLLNGATTAAGHVSQAFSLDGNDDFMQAETDKLPTGNADRTIELWVKADTFPTSGGAYFAGYGNFGSATQTYHLGASGDRLFFSQWGDALWGPTLAANQWYHVAVTNSGASTTLYLNGTAVGSGSFTINTPANSQFFIGRIAGALGDSRRLDGLVDEVSVYERALTATEVAAIHVAGIGGKIHPATLIAIDDVAQEEGDTGTSELVFTVARSGDTSGISTVDWATSDGTATAGTDYLVASGQVFFAAGETQQSISVTVNGDSLRESHETFSVQLSSAVGAYIVGDSQATGTILNDDISISIGDTTVTEGDETIRFIDVFVPGESGGLRNARGIEFGPDGNIYVSGESDPSNPIQLGFVNRYDSETGAFIDVFASDSSMTGAKDVEFGPDGNLYVTNNVGSNVYRFDGATGDFIDVFVPTGSGGLDTPRQLIFGPDGNSDGKEDLYVVSAKTDSILRYDGDTGAFLDAFVTSGSGGLNEPTAITFGPDGNFYVAAGAHEDFNNQILRYDGSGAFIDVFVPTGSAGLTLAPTAGMIFGPDVNGDTTPDLYVSNGEVDEVLIYDGSNGSYLDTFVEAGLGGMDDPKGLVFDSDGNLLAVNNGDHSVRRYGVASQAMFTVSLPTPVEETVTVDFATTDGTATAGGDYESTSGTVVFDPGVTTRTILVKTLDDVEEESAETFLVTLSNASGVPISGTGTGAATIIDNDTSANANDTYVWDITSDTRSRGPNLDYRVEVVVRQDSNADGLAGGSDAFVAGAQVSVTITGPNSTTLSGTTDSNGVFRSDWVKSVQAGNYTAVVDSLTLNSPLVRNADLDVVTAHNFTVGSALLAESLGSNDEASSITPEVAQFLLGEAMRRFASEGADVASLHGVNVRITDLDGMTLGMTTGNRIVLDDNAAGHGYFIDPTPWEDSEFIIPGDQGEQGHIDALSVVAHELGHLLGFAHEEQGVMKETLATGERSLLHATASGTAEASPAALSSTQEKTRTIPFRVNGGGLAPKGIPVFPGGTAPHDATGIAAHLGLYSGEGADPQSDVFRLINFTSATTGTFESVQPFVFTAANGDQLAFHYGRTDAGATTTGTFEIFDAGDGLIYVVFVAEFTPVAEESTGRFANVTGGSFIMVATTEPFSLIPDEPFSEPFSYTWEGEGTIELANGRT